jgi:lantibiotic biosynthesis protein
MRNAVTSHGSSRSPPSTWIPVLEGAARDDALAIITHIAEAIAARPLDDPSLAGGSAGRTLLHARLADDDPVQREVAITSLRHALPTLRERGRSASLYRGAAGIGWVLAHLAGDLLDDHDRCGGLDQALAKLLERRPWPGHYDLVDGLVGIGVYAMERLDARGGPALLEQVLARLAEVAVHTDEGVYWWTPPRRLPDAVRDRSPQGHVNLGLAHGVPGVIALLGGACAAGAADATSRQLLDGAVAWLLSEGLSGEVLPSWLAPDDEPEPARTAWCYGEPGVAAALLVAARAAGEASWAIAALRLARQAAARSVDETGVVDAGLCHGAAGLGLVFARLHHATGEPDLLATARSWFEHTLDLRVPGTGIAGFAAEGRDGPTDDPGLLTGATGVALALHAAATTREPHWDRILLLSNANST